MQNFVCLSYIWSNIKKINSHIIVKNRTHNQVHKYTTINDLMNFISSFYCNIFVYPVMYYNV